MPSYPADLYASSFLSSLSGQIPSKSWPATSSCLKGQGCIVFLDDRFSCGRQAQNGVYDSQVILSCDLRSTSTVTKDANGMIQMTEVGESSSCLWVMSKMESLPLQQGIFGICANKATHNGTTMSHCLQPLHVAKPKLRNEQAEAVKILSKLVYPDGKTIL